ncbi:hypothetical protein GCM10009525_87760 [Streptosporangium amethystogenes subsp. fukuiense]
MRGTSGPQAKQSESAKRLPKARRRKESRFARDVDRGSGHRLTRCHRLGGESHCLTRTKPSKPPTARSCELSPQG